MSPLHPPQHRRIRLLVAVTIMAWATHTLVQQWGYGQELSSTPMRFVPHDGNIAGGTLELRSEATVIGTDVTVRQICRWSQRDEEAFAPIANLVILRIAPGAPYRTITLDEIKSILHDAGVNLGRVRFIGATVCTVARRDVHFDEGDALRQWVAAKESAHQTSQESTQTPNAYAAAEASVPDPALPGGVGASVRRTSGTPARQASHPVITEPVAARPDPTQPVERPVFRRLRDALVDSLAQETQLTAEQLVVEFSPRDDHLLNLIEPHFRFHVSLTRGQSLGRVAWDVLIDAGGGDTQRARITGTARAWQQQLVVTKPLAFKQIIREDDLIDRRTLVDQLPSSPLLERSQAVGQMAAMELKPGTVLTARMVDAVPLVRPGQLVTVLVQSGGIEIRSVARALQSGTHGQTVRVRNETTRDIYDVTMIGPQMAVMGASDSAEAHLAAGFD